MSKKMGQVYLSQFESWAASMSDDDFRKIVYTPKGILNRQEIKRLSGISDQAIKKNPNVVEALRKLEEELRDRGVLSPLTNEGEQPAGNSKLDDNGESLSVADSGLDRYLESDNHDLRLRISVLEKEIADLRSRLECSKEVVEALKDGLAVFTTCPSN